MLVTALAGAIACGACTESPPTAPASPLTGTWTLVSVDNQPLPRTIAVLLGGSVRRVTAGEIIVRSRGRLDDTKRIVLQQGSDVLDDLTDTLTSPFTVQEGVVLVRRYGLMAADDWTDTGSVNGNSMTLRVRYLEPVYRTVQRVTLTYQRNP